MPKKYYHVYGEFNECSAPNIEALETKDCGDEHRADNYEIGCEVFETFSGAKKFLLKKAREKEQEAKSLLRHFKSLRKKDVV